MDLRQLRYFVAIAEAGSLGAAARHVTVTQPALTSAMQKLETDLCTPLLRRRGRGIELTAAGQLLYDEGRTLLDAFASLEDRIRHHGRDESETIRIGLTVLFSMQYMQHLARFMASHRNVALTMVQDGSPELQRALAEGDIDLGVLSYPQFESGIEMESLPGAMGGYDVAVVMSEHHPLAERERVAFADLAHGSWSSFSERFVLGRLLRERLPGLGEGADIVFINDDWEVLLASVRTLGTTSLLPAPFERLTTQTGLSWRPLDDASNRFDVGIATRKGQELSPSLAELVEALRRSDPHPPMSG